MKPYIHNPNLYRDHYRSQTGGELPGFRGMSMQHGNGIGALLSKLARKAIPLIMSGAKMIKPHVINAAKGVAKDVTGKIVSSVMNIPQKRKRARKPKSTHKRRKVTSTSIRRRKESKRTTSPDIFD